MSFVRPTRTLAIATLAALTLAACGGSNDADDTTTTAAETTTTAAETTTTTTAAETTTTSVPAGDNIIDVLNEAGQFTTLLQLIDQAGIADDLRTRQITLLAPTDDAFLNADPALIEGALNDVDALRELLLNHVIATPQTAENIAIFNNVVTAGGGDFTVATVDGQLMIGDAMVVLPNLEASNGYVQGINAVLLKAS
jgi:uncharacterized surface protein with fasciclin (FAS1) repeats